MKAWSVFVHCLVSPVRLTIKQLLTKTRPVSLIFYNHKRPHASQDYLTAEQAHHRNGELKKRWKHYSKSAPATGYVVLEET